MMAPWLLLPALLYLALNALVETSSSYKIARLLNISLFPIHVSAIDVQCSCKQICDVTVKIVGYLFFNGNYNEKTRCRRELRTKMCILDIKK